MTYTIKTTYEEIVSPNKKKFKKTISPWIVGEIPVANDISIYHYLLLESITAPDGEAIMLTFNTHEVQIGINLLEINLRNLM